MHYRVTQKIVNRWPEVYIELSEAATKSNGMNKNFSKYERIKSLHLTNIVSDKEDAIFLGVQNNRCRVDNEHWHQYVGV